MNSQWNLLWTSFIVIWTFLFGVGIERRRNSICLSWMNLPLPKSFLSQGSALRTGDVEVRGCVEDRLRQRKKKEVWKGRERGSIRQAHLSAGERVLRTGVQRIYRKDRGGRYFIRRIAGSQAAFPDRGRILSWSTRDLRSRLPISNLF